MTYFTDTFFTPVGTEFSVALDTEGSLVATAFGSRQALRRRFMLPQPTGVKARAAAYRLVEDTAMTKRVRDQVLAYFAGELEMFTLPLASQGTAFQRRVWSALQQIPFGETRSYRQLAQLVGNPAASRAVGRANGANPICLIVPCHRVIGADGSLTGFAFGEEIKRRLLEHERSVAMRSRAA